VQEHQKRNDGNLNWKMNNVCRHPL